MAKDTLSDDYQTVVERIRIFREKYPEGSLRPLDPSVPFRIVEAGGQTYVAVAAAAYRSPTDPAPGAGMAWEQVPGTTEYTQGSELMCCETSAWGRAIVAVLAADTRKVASRDEVVSAQARRAAPAPAAAAAGPSTIAAAVAVGTVQPDGGPVTHDAADDPENRAVIAEVMKVLQDPEVTQEKVRDLWNVLAQARLLAWRVEPFGGVPADRDGKVTVGTLVAALGKAKSGAV